MMTQFEILGSSRGDDTERLRRGIFIEIAPSALLPRNDGILNVIPRSSRGDDTSLGNFRILLRNSRIP